MTAEPFKFYRLYLDPELPRDNSELSQKLRAVTGLSIDDYEPPVATAIGEIVSLFSDESRTKDHYAVSVVMTHYRQPAEFSSIENRLASLIENRGMSDIHFRNVFGRTQGRVLSSQGKQEFSREYAAIVRGIPLICLAQSHDKSSLRLALGAMSEREIYFQLFLNIVQRAIAPLPEHSIFHLYREQPLSFMPVPTREDQQQLIDEYCDGILEVIKREKKYESFCKHPHFFSKRALLVSSLADLAAYTSSVIQNQVGRSVPSNKIIRQNALLLSLFKAVFPNYSGFTSSTVIELLNRVDTSLVS